VNAAQHKLFDMFVQATGESRAHAQGLAWTILGVLLVVALITLATMWLWILRGGFSNWFSLNSALGRKAVADWLREP
jgi:flagellar basal body-associated protein FliL